MKKIILYNILLLLILSLIVSCNSKSNEKEAETAVKIDVTVTHPQFGDFANYLELNANSQYQVKGIIRANVSGYVTSLPWNTGDRINAGSIFAEIKTKEQSALNNIDIKDKSLQQFQTAIKINVGVSGIVNTVNYSQGDFVNEGDILGEVVQPTSLVLMINVPYEYHEFAGVGKSCTVILPDGKLIPSIISEAMPTVDANSQTQPFLIHPSSGVQLPDGMNLIVHIPLKEVKNVLSVPRGAVQSDETQENFWVMKVINNSMAVKVPVVIGLQNDSIIEIKSGNITQHDMIVVNGSYGMPDSSSIVISKK
jgi:multidrug efflux pump subunit AcrA (membrane-fusion protein)